jgi:hypothetical protein
MTEFSQPFPGWVKAMAASVVCLWLALVCWVWRNPGWVWGGGKLYFRCVFGGFVNFGFLRTFCKTKRTIEPVLNLISRKRLDNEKKKS